MLPLIRRTSWISRLLLALLAALCLTSAPAMAAKASVAIGISGSSASSKSVTSMMVMVRTLGAEPILLTDHQQRIDQAGSLDAAIRSDLASVDAIIIMGNDDDIDPARYGQSIVHPETKVETNLARRDYEEAIILSTLDKKLPLLGICGGHQRINVLSGGTLHQHVPDITGSETHMQANTPPFIAVQHVSIKDGTMLASIADKQSQLYTPAHDKLADNIVMENSFHHQAINKLGEGLRINAISEDGIIEGIEAAPTGKFAGQFVLGVQWHPEFGASPLSPRIVARLIDEARMLKAAGKALR